MIACGLALYCQVLLAGVGLPDHAVLPALLLLGWWSVRLVVIDAREFRLPDAHTIPLTLGAGALLLWPSAADPSVTDAVANPAWLEPAAPVALAELTPGASNRWTLAVAGGAALGLVYLVVHLLGRGAFGFGDVKFAIPLGIVAAWFGPRVWMMAASLPFLIAAAVGLALVLGRSRPWSTRIPFGPCMLAGVVSAVVLDAVGR